MSSPPPLELGPCRRCGYDLRGLRPGGKCPECGEAIPKGTATLGGEAAKRASEVSLGLDWIARAALWPLPLAVGCAQLSGCFGAPILVATTGFSWLRLLGIQKVSVAWPDAPNRGLATGIASVECAIAGILALSTIFATAGPLPFAMPSVALPAWILAATVSTITARRLTVDVVASAGGGTGRGVLETLGSAGLLLGGIAMAGGRATAWALGTGAATAAMATIVALSLVGGLVLGASALAIWFSTSRLAGEFPSLPRFRPRRGPAIEGGLPPKPEPAPMDVAPPRPVAEREPIELEPPTLPKERPEAATREIPEKTEEADDDLWNGWKR